VDAAERDRFAALSGEWWDPDGAFKPLHRLNPVRLEFIRDRLAAHFGRKMPDRKPLAGLRILDIGCGGGLVCEPLCRLGATVCGIDPAPENIDVARDHATGMGLDIDYRSTTAEALAALGEEFDAVISLEVIEHVPDAAAFLATCSGLLAEGGGMVLATLNRTPKSFLFAIVGAEYLLGWLPRGTHRWDRFVRPSELEAALRPNRLRIKDIKGMRYDPFTGDWRLDGDVAVNYIAFAVGD
jgi:2-polyprenyl-6-hydroxyphenyl methylase/3-demethylubiquinone-9 3-methyltransferase